MKKTLTEKELADKYMNHLNKIKEWQRINKDKYNQHQRNYQKKLREFYKLHKNCKQVVN